MERGEKMVEIIIMSQEGGQGDRQAVSRLLISGSLVDHTQCLERETTCGEDPLAHPA